MTSVSIVAMGKSAFNFWQDLTDKFEKPTDEVWAINNAAVWINPDYVDLGIAMDDPGRDFATHPEYVDKLGNMPFAMLTTNDNLDFRDGIGGWPAFKRYPIENVVESLNLLGPAARCLTNSCCYALALALHRKFSKIVIYGGDFIVGEAAHTYDFPEVGGVSDDHWPDWARYHGKKALMHRRPQEPGQDGMMFLLGIAHQRGIEVEITRGSTLFDTDRDFYLYGYQEQPEVSDIIGYKIAADIIRGYRPIMAADCDLEVTKYLRARMLAPPLDTAESIDELVRGGSGVGPPDDHADILSTPLTERIDHDFIVNGPPDGYDPNGGLSDG